MWYVIQVCSGREEEYKNLIESVCKDSIEKCQIPVVIYEVKRHGTWNAEERILFPGYVFVKTEDPIMLFGQLEVIESVTKLLCVGEEIVPINEEEKRFLLRVGNENMVIEMSRGIIINGEIVILSGPLAGLESSIKKIDRHKRKAWVEMNMLERSICVPFGVEIMRKS